MSQPPPLDDTPDPDGDTALDRLTRELARSNLDGLSKLFTSAGARTPRIVWSPSEQEFRHPLISRFAHICGEHLKTDGRIRIGDFDLTRFDAIRNWVMTLDVIDPAGEFAFGHFGQDIAKNYGSDMTGRPLSALAPHIGLFYTALYRAACLRKEPFFSEHEPPRQIFVQSWLRLIVPVFDRTDTVVKFVALNYPENSFRAGLEIVPDPVLVADEQMIVRFANERARRTFGEPHSRTGPKELVRLIGADLRPERSPAEMFDHDIVENRVVPLRIGNGLADDFLITINAMRYAGSAFYVVMIRPVTPGM